MDDSKDLQGLNEKAEKASVAELAVKAFMSKNPVNIPDGSRIFSAIQMLSAHHVSSAPVVDAQGKMLGVISEHDLLIQSATRDLTEKITYIRDVTVVTATTKLKDCLLLMYKNKRRRLPVVDEKNHVIGVVSRMDVLVRLINKDKVKETS